jgi:hypothetical protein
MFTEISERQFDESDPIFRVIVHDYPWKFGSLQLPKASHALTLCWRSELVDPVISSNPFSLGVWIGIDQRIACVTPEGNTLFSMGLRASLLQIKHFAECTIVVSEDQALAIDHAYTLRRIYDLIEIPDTFDIQDGQFTVIFIDGQRAEWPI